MGMKKRKFLGKRGLSVLLSLALCMGMASPAFAASFSQLQGAIDTGESVYQEGMNADSMEEGAAKYKIEASKDENGISVKLWEDVEFNKKTDVVRDCAGAVASKYDAEVGSGIWIDGKDKNVTLDLNGKAIDFNPGYTLNEGTFKDKDGKEVDSKDLNKGRVISLSGGARLTVNDSTAIREDAEGNEYYYFRGQR